MLARFYNNKKVFVTGYTGFKGAWLSLWLKKMGAEVTGYALDPPTTLSLHQLLQKGLPGGEYRADIRSYECLKKALSASRPEIVFHLAAQSLVRRSYNEPLETLTTNAIGTANLLEAIRELKLDCTVVVVTTDKCYENREWEYAYRENDALGGHDVYSASKAAAEIVTAAWRRSFFDPKDGEARIASARGGNVIGGGDFSSDRLFPDLYRAFHANKTLQIRNPNAIRPWQHVLDCLNGYLCLAQRLHEANCPDILAGAYNFGPAPGAWRTVRELVDLVRQQWPGRFEITAAPNDEKHEAGRLALDSSKAMSQLNWRPAWSFSEAVTKTVDWYRTFSSDSADAVRKCTEEQIRKFEQDCQLCRD